MYEIYLTLENVDHLKVGFAQYLQEYGENICSDYADISYMDGKVQFSVHTRCDDLESNDEEDGSVSLL